MSRLRGWAAADEALGRGARPGLVIATVLGVAFGLSPFAHGYYPSSTWVPIGLGLLVVLTATLIAVPVQAARRTIVAPAALAALALLSLLSALWTDSIEQAILEGNRLFVYAAALALLVVVLRSDHHATAAFAAFAAFALAVAGWVVAAMLRGDATIFLDGRLHDPLGYINGQTHFFLLAFWPCLALAERRRAATMAATAGVTPSRAVAAAAATAGLGLAAATLFAGLAVLGQSRGAVLAAAGSAIIVLALLPGRLRRVVALLVAGGCLAPALPALLDVFNDRATDAAMRDGAVALLLACAAAGTIWAALFALEQRGRAAGLRPRRVVAIAVAVLAVLTAAVAVASAERITRVVDRQYSAFVTLDAEPRAATTSRLASGVGNRYDYWRVALDAWQAHPLAGVGAGGYDKPYFAHRATAEAIRQPHSLPLQVLTELGLAGGLVFAGALLAVAAGAWRRIRDGGRAPVVVAAVGVVSAWFVHAAVDWMHLLPGLTGVALLGAAVLLRPAGGDEGDGNGDAARAAPHAGDAPVRSRTARVLPVAAIGVVIAIAALSLSRQGLSELYVDRAEAALARDPQRALVESNRALRLDREATAAYYVKAAALARFDEAGAARSVLLDAARREPRDFVTWVLLGDLSVRRGDLPAARRAYSRALRLNPREEGLAKLAADPASADPEGRR